MKKVFLHFLLSLLLLSCGKSTYVKRETDDIDSVKREIIITDNIVHRKTDWVKLYSFPPRAISKVTPSKKNIYVDSAYTQGVVSLSTILVDELPIPIHSKAPNYPEIARSAGKEGEVMIIAWINTNGSVRKAAAITTTDTIFVTPSLEAIMYWTFSPSKINGESVESTIAIPFKFKLNQGRSRYY